MKRFVLSAILCLLTFQAFSQNSFFVRASVNPLVMPIGETGFKEFGVGFYDFNYEEKPMQEYGIAVGKKLANNQWSIGLELNFKKYRTEFDFELHNYYTGFVFFESEGFIESDFIGLKPFTSYQLNDKVKLQVAVEINAPIEINKSRFSDSGILFTLGGSGGSSPGITITRNESFNLSYDPLKYIVPELQLAYNVFKNCDLTLGYRYKLNDKSEPSYQLLVDGGEVFEYFNGPTSVMNDSRIYRNFMAVSLGIDYTFNFNKK